MNASEKLVIKTNVTEFLSADQFCQFFGQIIIQIKNILVPELPVSKRQIHSCLRKNSIGSQNVTSPNFLKHSQSSTFGQIECHK